MKPKPNPTPALPSDSVSRVPWSAGPRIVYLTTPVPPLTPEELADTLGRLGADSPVSRALAQLLNQRIAIAMAEVASNRMADTDRAHAAGRLEELLGFYHELRQLTSPVQKEIAQ